MNSEKLHKGSVRSSILGLLVVLLVGMGLGLYLGKHSRGTQLADVWKRFMPAEKPREETKPSLPLPTLPLPPLPSTPGNFEQSVIAATERTMPAVVNVSTEKTIAIRQSPYFNDPFFRQFFGSGVPQERRESGLGSGVIISPNGYLLTNNHVVEGTDKVRVLLADQRRFEAKIIGTDPKTDVALLKIEGANLPTLPIGDSDQIRVGQIVLAIGNPFGLNQTVTLGIISAKGRSRIGIADYEDFIQTDAAINPGNSGGALVNLQGELIGINTAIESKSGGSQGVGFAIPSNMAKMVMDSLLKEGRVVRGFVGVSLQEMNPSLAKSLGLAESKGALVAEIFAGNPADQAGIKAGDVIVECDGKPVEDMMKLRNQVAQTPPGTSLSLKIFRNGAYLTKTMTVAEMKEKGPTVAAAEAQPEGESPMGISGQNLTPDLAQRLNLDPNLRGVVITRVQPGSRAEESGLIEGDVVVSANHQPVENVEDLRRVFKDATGKPILLVVNRQGSNRFIAIPEE